jgi:hypothetical protein
VEGEAQKIERGREMGGLRQRKRKKEMEKSERLKWRELDESEKRKWEEVEKRGRD